MTRPPLLVDHFLHDIAKLYNNNPVYIMNIVRGVLPLFRLVRWSGNGWSKKPITIISELSPNTGLTVDIYQEGDLARKTIDNLYGKTIKVLELRNDQPIILILVISLMMPRSCT